MKKKKDHPITSKKLAPTTTNTHLRLVLSSSLTHRYQQRPPDQFLYDPFLPKTSRPRHLVVETWLLARPEFPTGCETFVRRSVRTPASSSQACKLGRLSRVMLCISAGVFICPSACPCLCVSVCSFDCVVVHLRVREAQCLCVSVCVSVLLNVHVCVFVRLYVRVSAYPCVRACPEEKVVQTTSAG